LLSPITQMNILIVDDETHLRTLIKKQLESYSCTLHDAPDLDNAFNIAKSVKLDLVILDVRLHDQDGRGFLRAMKNKEIPQAPVIMITAEANRTIVSDAIQLGVKGFLMKPFDKNTLIERIRQIIPLESIQNKTTEQPTKQPKAKRGLEIARKILLFEPVAERKERILYLLKTTAWSVTDCESLTDMAVQLQAGTVDCLLINVKAFVDLSSVEPAVQAIIEIVSSQKIPFFGLGKAEEVSDLVKAKEMGIADYILDPLTIEKLEKNAKLLPSP